MRYLDIFSGLAICISLVSAPAFAEAWQPIPVKPGLDYLVDSAHRIADHVYLMERGTANTPQGPQKFEAPVEFDCARGTVRVAWVDVFAQDQAHGRFYGNQVNHYAAARFASAAGTQYGETLLQWACHLPMQQERLVNVRHGGGDILIQIDARSLSRDGSSTSFWTRYDYPHIQFDPPYNAPYDSKREFVTVNCDTDRFRIAVGYDMTAEGSVTDNMIARDEAQTPIDVADDYEVAIKAVACGKPFDAETYSGIGGKTIRSKPPLASDLDIDSVPADPEVISSARAFYALLPARPSFATAKIVETMKNTKLATSQTVLVIRPTKDDVDRVREIYSPDFVVDRDMLGLVQLKSKMNFRSSENRSVYVARKMTFKAQTWKEGSEFKFATESRQVPGTAKATTYGFDCHIEASVGADVVSKDLNGRAWPLDCTRLNGDVAKGYFIEALGYFFISHEESKDYGVSDTTIDSVSITR